MSKCWWLQQSVYLLADPRDGEVHYVGNTERIWERYRQHVSPSNKGVTGPWIRELRALGLRPVLFVVTKIWYRKHVERHCPAYGPSERAVIRWAVMHGCNLLNKVLMTPKSWNYGIEDRAVYQHAYYTQKTQEVQR